MRGGGKTSSIRSRCLKFHNFVPSDAASESPRLQEQHGTKKITVTSTPWLPASNCTPNNSECPVPVGAIVPSAAPLPQHLLALLRPTPPITHLTPEVTITPIIPTSASASQHSTSRKRKSDDVRRLLNIKISLKEHRKGDEQPLDLSLKKDDEAVAAEQLTIDCSESGFGSALPKPVPMYRLHLPNQQPGLASTLYHHHHHHHHHHRHHHHRNRNQSHQRLQRHHHSGTVSEKSILPTMANFSQYTSDLANQNAASGILIKTKQVSEGDATFCKFRQVRPPARPSGRQKKLNFMPSKWPQ